MVAAEFRIPSLSNFQQPINMIASSGLVLHFFTLENKIVCLNPTRGWMQACFCLFCDFLRFYCRTIPDLCKHP